MFKPLPSRTAENEKDKIIMVKLFPSRRVKRDYVNFFFYLLWSLIIIVSFFCLNVIRKRNIKKTSYHDRI